MNISELEPRQGNVDVEGTIKEVGEIKTFNKFGRELRVADAILEDDSGNVKLSLWNDDAERFKPGDKIKITSGYVNEFQGEKQLTSGKFGKIEKLGEGEESADGASSESGDSEGGENQEESTDESSEAHVEESAEEASEESEDSESTEEIKEEAI